MVGARQEIIGFLHLSRQSLNPLYVDRGGLTGAIIIEHAGVGIRVVIWRDVNLS